MNRHLFGELRSYYNSLYVDNEIRDKPIGIIENAKTSIEGIKRLELIFDIVLSSQAISEDTKLYIINIDWSMKDVNDKLNAKNRELSKQLKKSVGEVTYNSTVSRIRADENKLINVFGKDIIRDCVYNRVDGGYERIDGCIQKLIDTFGKDNGVRDNLMIKVRAVENPEISDMTSQDFFSMLESIECYLKQRKDIVEAVINADDSFVNRFNYLLSDKGILDDKAKADRKRLLHFLNNEDYSEEE